MAFERIELNICPAGDMPVFHCSQYDVGRPIIIDLKNGDDAFTPTAGTTFELHCRKVDDNIVTLDTYEVDGNTLTFTSTEQLCACPGDNLCEVAIYLDELCMGTLNFMLHVEPDPLAGGLESETQIYNLTEQVEEITQQIIGDDYYDVSEVDDLLDLKADKSTTYTKTEVDTALNLKADKSTTYTKTETNNLLAGKADASDTYSKAQVDSKLSLKADKATTYTKTETDTLLGYKANASQVYTMSQTDLFLADKADKSTTYTKIQVDDALALKANSADLATVATTGDYDDLLNKPTIPAAQVQSDYAQADNTQVDYIKNKPDIEGMIADAILDIMPVDTASGPIASFVTELDAPLVNVSCEVVATGGNGTPDSPIPINGYTEANITRCGVNLLEDDFSKWVVVNDYSKLTSISPENVELIATFEDNDTSVDASGCYFGYVSTDYVGNGSPSNYRWLLNNGSLGSNMTNKSTQNVDVLCNSLFIYPKNEATYNKIFSRYKIQIQLGNTATAYHPYNGNTDTIAFGQTVYGGVLDVTRGKLKPCIEYPSYNGETLSGRWLSSEATYVEGTTPPTGSQVVSLDDYDTDIDLTPVQIRALVGENNVYSDTNGNTTVQFKDSIQHYIDTKVGS